MRQFLWISLAVTSAGACVTSDHNGDPTTSDLASETTQHIGADIAAATVNLTNEAVSRTSSCSFDGCSVVFHNTICNRGTTTAFGSNVGGRWNANGTIHSACTGFWNAQNTFGTLAVGSCIDVIINGPGLVGPKVPAGSVLTYTGMVDFFCTTAETNDSDNSRTQSFTIP